ncbi:MAG TPA: hypothetical protein VGZ90_07575 [Puia sp.]|nr:hypothetical protein [Puia sp.]
MNIDNSFAYSQTETGHLIFIFIMHRLKRVKYFLLTLLLNSDSVVLDINAHHTVMSFTPYDVRNDAFIIGCNDTKCGLGSPG